MTETTYENLTRHIDRISAEMREIGEKMGLVDFRYWQIRQNYQRIFIPFTLD